jgi:GTPase SAR1 family protein
MASIKRVVMISGLQGSGKTTTANRLTQSLWAEGHKAVRFKFADMLYQMHDAVRAILKRSGLDDLKGVDGQLLQVLGTEWGRNTRGHDLWVRATRAAVFDYWFLNPDGVVVIDDCRFENEYKAFLGEEGVSVVQVRLIAPRDTRKLRAEKWRGDERHPSETGLEGLGDEWFDVVSDTSTESVESITRRILDELTRAKTRPTVTA